MGKFWVMGITLLLSFSAGLYVFIPEQSDKLMPDFASLLIPSSQKAIIIPPKIDSEQSVLGSAGEIKEENISADGRVVVPRALPPELKKLDSEVAKLTTELQEKVSGIQATALSTAGTEAEKIIQQADKLIAETNQKYGIDTSHVPAVLDSFPPITDPELKQIQEKLDTIDRDIQELERRNQR